MVIKILDRIGPKRKNNFDNLEFSLAKPTLFGDVNDNYKMEFVWRNIIVFVYLHWAAINMFFIPEKYSYTSIVIAWTTGLLAALGTTVS